MKTKVPGLPKEFSEFYKSFRYKISINVLFQFSSQSFSHSQMFLLCRNFGLTIVENSESTNTMVITGPDHSKGEPHIAGFNFHLIFGAGLIKIDSTKSRQH